ncbi:hypothetical protein HY625_01360 [Candidatus Uhrbacteria bacterium]|nr:hypothetical protein [Candidatus Uhrbacteria bacterium]
MRQLIKMQLVALVLFYVSFLGLRYTGVPWFFASIMGIALPYCFALMTGKLIASSFTDAVFFNIAMLTAFLLYPVIPFFDVPIELHWSSLLLVFAGFLLIAIFVFLIRWIKLMVQEEMRYGLAILAVGAEIVVVTSVLVCDLHGEPLWATTLAAGGGIVVFILLPLLAPRTTTKGAIPSHT